MSRTQSIVSFIVSAIMIFIVPKLNELGLIVDENTVTTVVVTIIAFGFFVWTAWKNHNITDSALEAQQYKEDLLEAERNEPDESTEDPSDDEVIEH